MEHLEPEVTISYCQAELSVKEQGQKTTHRALDPKCVLFTRFAGTKMDQRLKEWLFNDLGTIYPEIHFADK